MNILFISPNSPEDSIGGVERYITNLISYCKTQTHSHVYILLPTFKENYTVELHNVTIYYDNNLYIPKASVGIQKEIFVKSRSFAGRIEEIIKKNHVDIITAENFHVGLPPAFSLMLNMVASINATPLVLHLHSFASKDLQVELVNQLLWNRISCVSKSVTGDCFHKGANIDILSTDYLGVNNSEFNNDPVLSFNLKKSLNLPKETKIILSAGRIIVGKRNIIKEKGFINLIKAFSRLLARNKNIKLLIAVGKAPAILQPEFNSAMQMILGYIKLHNLEENAFVKQFGLHEMADVYKGSDIFVLSSENETFGQVFIESMACGLPIIGTKVGGIPEIISDSHNGFLITPDDPSRLAQKIEQLLTNETLRQQFITAGFKSVQEKFNGQKQFDNFFTKLQNITNIQ